LKSTTARGDPIFNELNRRIEEQFSNAEPDGDDIKEVYARFGLAYYHAEVLHRGLCNLYSLSQLPPKGPVTRPRVEEHIRAAFQATLGQLLVLLHPTLPPKLLQRLEGALERRNFIAHQFWYERIHLMKSMGGIDAMMTELSQDNELFSELDGEVEKVIAALYLRLGLTAEHLAMALDEVSIGKDLEPLNEQRKPRKEEIIIAVFDTPTPSGRYVLVFQTEDALLWQLCDAGLGWAPYDKAEPSWPVATKFSDLLPARINPRPKASAPWSFDIQFGSKATLSVRPGQLPGEVRYSLHLKGKQNHLK
jgi:hypothetical protein